MFAGRRCYNLCRGKEKMINQSSESAKNLPQPIETFLLFLIMANVAAVILSTEPELYADYRTFFDRFELVSVAIFIIEYIARLAFAPRDPRFAHPIRGRMRYALQPIAIVDLLAILPFFIPIVAFDLRIIRIIRMARIFRILKLSRYTDSIALIWRVLKARKEELGMIFLAGLIVLTISSAIIYFLEHPHQPDIFTSIPATMWWGVSILTTVGNIGIQPVTAVGRFFTSVIAIMAVVLVALPTGVLASGFSNELNARRLPLICPHCGKEINKV
jgi:voltage-gated potassium channel